MFDGMLPADKVLLQRLGARLRDLRERAKLTQDQVAENAGFGGKYIGEIEKGLRDVPLSTLRAIVESGLGLQIESVFNEKRTRVKRSAATGLPRDVEITAEMITALPMKARRPLLALLKALQDD